MRRPVCALPLGFETAPPALPSPSPLRSGSGCWPSSARLQPTIAVPAHAALALQACRPRACLRRARWSKRRYRYCEGGRGLDQAPGRWPTQAKSGQACTCSTAPAAFPGCASGTLPHLTHDWYRTALCHRHTCSICNISRAWLAKHLVAGHHRGSPPLRHPAVHLCAAERPAGASGAFAHLNWPFWASQWTRIAAPRHSACKARASSAPAVGRSAHRRVHQLHSRLGSPPVAQRAHSLCRCGAHLAWQPSRPAAAPHALSTANTERSQRRRPPLRRPTSCRPAAAAALQACSPPNCWVFDVAGTRKPRPMSSWTWVRPICIESSACGAVGCVASLLHACGVPM